MASTERGAIAGNELKALARRRLYHWLTTFEVEDELYPGVYPRAIVRAEGAYLFDDVGHRVLDGGHTVAACVVGHCREEIADAVGAQLRTLDLSTLDAGLTHPLAVELADRLAGLLPLDDAFLYFSNSGSESNELAFKLVRAYHRGRGEPARVKILCREDGYHGSTYGAMSASGIPALREPFAPLAPGFVRVCSPIPGRCGHCDRAAGCSMTCMDEIERTIRREGPETIAAFIGEPIPIAGAIAVPHPDYWPRLRELCDRHGILLIADEVVNGFGRTGRMFASERVGARPDVVTLAKGITSGYVPFSAMAVSGALRDAFRGRPLAHNATSMGHPIGCVAALATLDIIEREGLVERAAALEPLVRAGLDRLAERCASVTHTSCAGLLASAEVRVPRGRARELAVRFRGECYERGLIARFKTGEEDVTAFFYPPLIVSEAEAEQALDTLGDVIERWA